MREGESLERSILNFHFGLQLMVMGFSNEGARPFLLFNSQWSCVYSEGTGAKVPVMCRSAVNKY